MRGESPANMLIHFVDAFITVSTENLQKMNITTWPVIVKSVVRKYCTRAQN